MQYTYEIIDALDEYYKDDRQLKLNILEELYKTTKDEGFFDSIKISCEVYDLCPCCYSDNVADVYIGSEMLEVGEGYAERPEYKKICQDCGAEA